MTLLEKWKWKLGKEDKGLWSQVVESKYGSLHSLDIGKESSYEFRRWRDLKESEWERSRRKLV